MGDGHTQVAVDIETTGFEVSDEVTVLGFEFEVGSRLFLQTDVVRRIDLTRRGDYLVI